MKDFAHPHLAAEQITEADRRNWEQSDIRAELDDILHRLQSIHIHMVSCRLGRGFDDVAADVGRAVSETRKLFNTFEDYALESGAEMFEAEKRAYDLDRFRVLSFRAPVETVGGSVGTLTNHEAQMVKHMRADTGSALAGILDIYNGEIDADEFDNAVSDIVGDLPRPQEQE